MNCPNCKGVAFTETYESSPDGGLTWVTKTMLRCASRRLKHPCRPILAEPVPDPAMNFDKKGPVQ